MQSRYLIIIAVVTLLINGLAYPFLPDRVAIQIGFGGVLRSVPKAWFLVMMPAILLIVAAVRHSPDSRVVGVAVLLALLNVAQIVFALILP